MLSCVRMLKEGTVQNSTGYIYNVTQSLFKRIYLALGADNEGIVANYFDKNAFYFQRNNTM